MQRVWLGCLRFSLCTWVGVSTFFIVAVLRVLESLLYDRPPYSQFSQPAYFLPPYFAFGFSLLGAALLCALGGLWNPRIGLWRRWATLLLVAASFGLLAVDYAIIYRGLVALFSATAIQASTVMTLFEFSRLVKGAVVVMSVLAASLAVWQESSYDRPIRDADPAL